MKDGLEQSRLGSNNDMRFWVLQWTEVDPLFGLVTHPVFGREFVRQVVSKHRPAWVDAPTKKQWKKLSSQMDKLMCKTSHAADVKRAGTKRLGKAWMIWVTLMRSMSCGKCSIGTGTNTAQTRSTVIGWRLRVKLNSSSENAMLQTRSGSTTLTTTLVTT